MSTFDWKRNIEDSIKDGIIITATTTGIFFGLKGGKRKTTKGISGCHGYHETCRWDMWKSAGKGLCGLQEMDQRVIQQKFFWPPKGNKIIF